MAAAEDNNEARPEIERGVSNHPLADDQDRKRFIVRRRESLNYLSRDRESHISFFLSLHQDGLSGIHFGVIV
jgi:hypothetical protein